ncbi:MAG: glutathione S-transferase [Planctomycetota bacterium]|nr:MAG: glutathione S-transferase [Planctomycetota bacterium]
MPELVLYQYPGLGRERSTLSGPCAKVHMALAVKGLDYEVRNLRTPMEVRRIHPRGRVPVLDIDGERVADSTDILTALERRFPEPPLQPAEPSARAQCKILEDWADEVLYFYVAYLRWLTPEGFARIRRHIFVRYPAPLRWLLPWIARRETRARYRGQGVGLKDQATVERELRECLQALDQLLVPGPFVLGEQLTRADLALCAMVDQLAVAALLPEMAAELQARPVLAAWAERVHARAPAAT